MTRHAFIDESTRGRRYLICAVTISSADLGAARASLRALRPSGQRRIHFVTESDQRRRSLLKEMSTIHVSSTIYVADHRDQVRARGAIVATAVTQLHRAGVSRLVLESRDNQDHRDRAVIYQSLGADPAPPLQYTHATAAAEPLLWIPDAVAWAWGRGGDWRKRVEALGLVDAVQHVNTAETRKTRLLTVRRGAGLTSSG